MGYPKHQFNPGYQRRLLSFADNNPYLLSIIIH